MNTNTCKISMKQHEQLWGQMSLVGAVADAVYPTRTRGTFNSIRFRD